MRDPAEPVLAVVVESILGHCDPDEILLFGSWAKGLANPHSDVDILVVGPFTASPWIRDRELREALQEIPIEIDLHLLTPDEYAAGQARPHSYLKTLGETSRRLYRRD
jgi:predicted nucleotidyltransferase